MPVWLLFGLLMLALSACSVLGTIMGREAHQPPPGMVYVPGGWFLMGSRPEDGRVGIDIGVDEFPQHRVFVKAFSIDQYEVTVGHYRTFVEATGSRPPRVWKDPDYPRPEADHPVIDVSWYDAEAYCRWANKRLPTEIEWEKAARGTDGRLWPWGNRFDPSLTNVAESGIRWTAPVGAASADVSPYGVHGMAGNTMEWTSSWYLPYPGSQLRRATFGETFKVLRGGSWRNPGLPFSRSANRHAVFPHHDLLDQGLRCAKDAG